MKTDGQELKQTAQQLTKAAAWVGKAADICKPSPVFESWAKQTQKIIEIMDDHRGAT
jgi:hypothetical protein